jgi:hypothetical protein
MFRATLRVTCAAAVLVAACSDSSGPEGDRRVSVLLTDAPGDILEAHVTIDRIYLQAGDDDTEDNGRVVLMDEPVTVDLLTLQDEMMTLVQNAEIPEGEFGQLRFVISGGYIVVEGEEGTDPRIFATSEDYAELPQDAVVSGQLKMPSFSTSGLKVNFVSGLVLDEETTLLVDFDVEESFGHEAGASGMWVMHPVLKGSVVEEEVTPRRSR